MRHDEGRLEGRGKLNLYRQAWLPDAEARAVVVLAHGGSEHSGRYAHVGDALAAAGYAVHALDHRGHGRSDGARAFMDRMDNFVADLHTLRAHAEAEHPGAPVFLLGHSMGGCIALRYVRDHEAGLAGLILSAPVAALEAANPVQRAAARVLSVVAPKLGVFSIDSSGVSRDPEVVRAYDADPLVVHAKLPARTVAELAAAVETFPDSVRMLSVPLLILSPTADRIVPPAACEMVYERAGSTDKTIHHYEGLFHEAFNEPERDEVIADVVAWLNAHT